MVYHFFGHDIDMIWYQKKYDIADLCRCYTILAWGVLDNWPKATLRVFMDKFCKKNRKKNIQKKIFLQKIFPKKNFRKFSVNLFSKFFLAIVVPHKMWGV
jgi:hypothetical protein